MNNNYDLAFKDKCVWGIVLLFCITNNFYNFKPLVISDAYDKLVNLFVNSCFFIFIIYSYYKRHFCPISKCVVLILTMFAISILYPSIFWNQSIYYTFRSMGALFPLCFFFVFYFYRVNTRQMITAIIILCMIYCLFELIALYTYPNNIIGYTDLLKDTDLVQRDIDNRGVIRFNMPGADFVVFVIFFSLNRFRYDKKNYILLLLPLFFILLLRGTRTPLFVVLIMTLVILFYRKDRKWIISLLCLIIFFISIHFNNILLQSKSDNIFVKYIQLTSKQMSTNDMDIRLVMTKYLFTEFNSNPLQYIFGNGINSVGEYGKRIKYIADMWGYCITDSLPANLFLYFGFIGIILYFYLFIVVIRVKVRKDVLFAKWMAIYMFLIGSTNVALLSISPMIFAMCLYVISIGRIKSNKLKAIRYYG